MNAIEQAPSSGARQWLCGGCSWGFPQKVWITWCLLIIACKVYVYTDYQLRCLCKCLSMASKPISPGVNSYDPAP